jgi:acyl-coenzyme A thioesterase PaaI-like protein
MVFGAIIDVCLFSRRKLMSEMEIRNDTHSRFKMPVQEYYPKRFSHCFGCGRSNACGLHTKTHWNSKEEVGYCRLKPQAHLCGYTGVLHGGIISSVIECNTVATAIAATCEAEDLMPELDIVCFVLASINARFVKPAPIESEIMVLTKVDKLQKRRALCTVRVLAADTLCSIAETVAIRVPYRMIRHLFLKQTCTGS